MTYQPRTIGIQALSFQFGQFILLLITQIVTSPQLGGGTVFITCGADVDRAASGQRATDDFADLDIARSQ